MKTFITAAAITLATFGAFAQEATPAPEIDNFVSTRTRAEVVADVTNAIARGERLSQGEASRAPEMERFVATRSRAEVVAELTAAIQRGEHLSQGESSRAPEMERFAAQRSRAEVRAEAAGSSVAHAR